MMKNNSNYKIAENFIFGECRDTDVPKKFINYLMELKYDDNWNVNGEIESLLAEYSQDDKSKNKLGDE